MFLPLRLFNCYVRRFAFSNFDSLLVQVQEFLKLINNKQKAI